MPVTDVRVAEAFGAYDAAFARVDPTVDVEADLHTPTTNLISALGDGEVMVLSEHSMSVGRPDLTISRAHDVCNKIASLNKAAEVAHPILDRMSAALANS